MTSIGATGGSGSGPLPDRQCAAREFTRDPVRQRFSPGLLLVGVIIACIGAAVLTIALSLSGQIAGLRLAVEPGRNAVVISSVVHHDPAVKAALTPGLQVVAIGPAGEAWSDTASPAIQLTPADLIDEPDGLDSYAAVSDFLERQTRLAGILGQRAMALHVVDSATQEAIVATIQLRPRSVADLPLVFWIQLVSGVAGLAIGAWVWSMRRGDLAAQMFALSGLGLFVSALPAAIYSTRELAIDGSLFFGLTALNHAGVHLFGGAMIALFLSYPRCLIRPVWLLAIPACLLPVLLADIAHQMPDPITGMYGPMLAEMALIIILVARQWRLAQDELITRAALRWLGLSVVVGAGAFVLGIAVPLLFQASPAISQGYAFAFFLIVYGGIALGIQRYRLFDLGNWAFRILFYAGGAVLLLLLDASLIWLLQIEREPAFGIALIIVGFAYLPLRDVVWRRIYGRRSLPEHEVFASAMAVAFGLTASERAAQWRGLLSRLYDPLVMTAVEVPVMSVTLEADGLDLLVPPVADSTALRLRYPFSGKGMFSPRDVRLTEELVTLVVEAEISRSAYERGVAEERQRIARDLHDDVGARLLTGLHSVDGRTRPLLQAALADIRAIVSGLNGEEAPLDLVLAEARHEAARRLEAAGIALHWPAQDENRGALRFDYRQTKALVSSVREVVSNIIRHSQATRVCAEIALTDSALMLRLTDNGRGLPASTERPGYGLRNIQRRIEEIGGRLRITSTSDGTDIEMSFPLNWPKAPAFRG